MNGPMTMFRTAQFVRHDQAVDLPGCMYKIKNIHGGASATNGNGTDTMTQAAVSAVPTAGQPDIGLQVKQFLQNNIQLPEMAALHERQTHILKQLEDLKQQMHFIRKTLKSTTGTCPKLSTSCQNKKFTVPQLAEIIINAHPQYPPYSLALLQRLWSNTLHFEVSQHLHSSVAELPQKAKTLSEQLSLFRTEAVPKIKVRLIWKNAGVNKFEAVLSRTPIVGEANLLRYLARVTNGLNYDENNFEVDDVLELSHALVEAELKTERAKLVQQLNKQLGKSDYLFGKSPGIADAAAFSAVKQTGVEANVNLGKWLARCETVA